MNTNNEKNLTNKISASIAVIRNGNHLLFQKRKKEPYVNLLGLLGGKIEQDESPKNAIIREVLEESALSLTNLSYEGEVAEFIKRQGSIMQVNLQVFTAEGVGRLKHNEEEGEVFWIHVDKLQNWKDRLIPTDWLIVRQVLNGGLDSERIVVISKGNKYEIVKA